MTSDEEIFLLVEKQINDFISCWEQKGERFIKGATPVTTYIQEAHTPCDEYLVINKFQIHDLPLPVLRKLPMMLTKTLKFQVNTDHFYFWAYCAEILHRYSEELFQDDRDILNRFSLIVHVNLMASHKLFPSEEDNKLRRIVSIISSHIEATDVDSFIISAHLAYPLVEGIVRWKCSDYLEKDGTIKKTEKFVGNDGTNVELKSGHRLNRINTGLRLLETKVADDQLKIALQLYRDAFETVYGEYFQGRKTYDIIDEWRNNLLHGKEYWQTGHAAILNLVCMLLLFSLDETKYDKQNILKNIEFNYRSRLMGSPNPWSFYPP